MRTNIITTLILVLLLLLVLGCNKNATEYTSQTSETEKAFTKEEALWKLYQIWGDASKTEMADSLVEEYGFNRKKVGIAAINLQMEWALCFANPVLETKENLEKLIKQIFVYGSDTTKIRDHARQLNPTPVNYYRRALIVWFLNESYEFGYLFWDAQQRDVYTDAIFIARDFLQDSSLMKEMFDSCFESGNFDEAEKLANLFYPEQIGKVKKRRLEINKYLDSLLRDGQLEKLVRIVENYKVQVDSLFLKKIIEGVLSTDDYEFIYYFTDRFIPSAQNFIPCIDDPLIYYLHGQRVICMLNDSNRWAGPPKYFGRVIAYTEEHNLPELTKVAADSLFRYYMNSRSAKYGEAAYYAKKYNLGSAKIQEAWEKACDAQLWVTADEISREGELDSIFIEYTHELYEQWMAQR